MADDEEAGAEGEEADVNDDDIIILVVVRSFVGELYVLSISLFLPLLSAFNVSNHAAFRFFLLLWP